MIFLTFAVAVFLSDTRPSSKKVFTTLALATFWWQFSWFVLFNTLDAETASFVAKIGHIGILFLPLGLYHLTINITRREQLFEKVTLAAGYVLYAAGVVTLFTTSMIVDGVYEYSWGFYPQAGALHPLLVAVVVVYMLLSVRVLLVSRNAMASSVKKQQITYFLWAILFYNLAAVDFATNYGLGLYPIGFVFLIIFISLVWRSISHHYLMNISQYFNVIASYIFVFIYAWLIFETFMRAYTQNNDIVLDQGDAIFHIFGIAVFVAVGVVMYQLSHKVIQSTLGEYRDPNRLLVKVHEEIIESKSKDELFEVISQILSYVFPTDHAYVIHQSKGEPEVIPGEDSSKTHPLNVKALPLFPDSNHALVRETITPDTIKYFALPQGEQEQILDRLRSNCIGLVTPITHNDEYYGRLVFGEKPYREPFSDTEKQFIERIAPIIGQQLARLEKHKTKDSTVEQA